MELSSRPEPLTAPVNPDPRGAVSHPDEPSVRLPNDDTLARMLATQAVGGGALPMGLGLEPVDFWTPCWHGISRRFPANRPTAPGTALGFSVEWKSWANQSACCNCIGPGGMNPNAG